MQVDESIINILPDEKLAIYVPKYGDRVAIAAFVKALHEAEIQKENQVMKKSLIERLKCKVKRSNEHSTRSVMQKGNSNAKKKERRVEVGWLDYDNITQRFCQVKRPTGGGIKHAIFPLDRTVAGLIPEIKEWFFPKGVNRLGCINDYDTFLRDTTHKELTGDLTVDELYMRDKNKLLRIYLATKCKQDKPPTKGIPTKKRPRTDTGHSTKITALQRKRKVEVINISSDIEENPVSSMSDAEIEFGKCLDIPGLKEDLDDTLPIFLKFSLTLSHQNQNKLHQPTQKIKMTKAQLHKTYQINMTKTQLKAQLHKICQMTMDHTQLHNICQMNMNQAQLHKTCLVRYLAI